MWIHSYRPLRDHCELSKLGGARGSHLSPLPPEARSCASRAAPRGSRRGPKPGPAARSCRAQPLLAPPRGPLSATGGLDSLRQSAGFSTARLRAVESSRVGQCPAGSSARGARPAASAARTLPAPSAPSARTLHQHVSRMLKSNWPRSINVTVIVRWITPLGQHVRRPARSSCTAGRIAAVFKTLPAPAPAAGMPPLLASFLGSTSERSS